MPSPSLFQDAHCGPCRKPRTGKKPAGAAWGEPRYRGLRPTCLPALLLASSVWLSGCATPQNPDPLESMNRKTFALNEGVDKAVLKPVATAYKTAVPARIRTGVSNFFSNLGDPWSGVNLFLQGRVKDGLSDFGRFGTNTTVGLLGVMDVATDWGMPHQGEDFNDTLGSWGVASGAYLVFPLFGPSDLRGLAALPINIMASASSQISDAGTANVLTVLGIVDTRAGLLEITELIDDVALDKYLFIRDAYLQRRKQRESEPAHDSDGDGDHESAAEMMESR
jgi:phospholipid-binding lipoprotein MlaA